VKRWLAVIACLFFVHCKPSEGPKERVPSVPEVALPGTPQLPAAEGRLIRIGRFEGYGNPRTGELWMRALPMPTPVRRDGVAVSRQALTSTQPGYCELDVVADGTPGSNPAGTFEFYTQGEISGAPEEQSSFDVTTCYDRLPAGLQNGIHLTAFTNFGVGCGYQHIGNFTGRSFENVYMDIDVFNGDLALHGPYGPPFTTGTVGTPTDGRNTPVQDLGLWDFGPVDADGPGSSVNMWIYFKDGDDTDFTFTGYLLAKVYEECGALGMGDGVDDDCDGIEDNGCGIAVADADCFSDLDCRSGICTGALIVSGQGQGGGSLGDDVPGACAAVCGDNITEGPEACDDGGLVNGDGCDDNCTATACGNGVVTAGESCDDGNMVNGDGCDNNCTVTACRNSIQTAGEACDDGNLVNGDGCDNNCSATACQNGVLTAGEECDDGNDENGDGCDFNCTETGCGNGVVTGDEECDDGNTVNGDGCDNDCTPSCGDGIVHAIEGCDVGGGFRISSLTGNNCQVFDHAFLTGDDRGGIAVGATQLLYSGDSATGRFAKNALSTTGTLSSIRDALVSDLQTQQVFSLGTGATPLSSGGSVTSLLALDELTGAVTGQINLSQSFTVYSGSGLFAGHGFVAVSYGSHVFEIDTATGAVIDHVFPGYLSASGCENWAFWGVAEHINGALHLSYVQGNSIVRTRVSDGGTSTVQTFSNLSDMCSFTVSPSDQRWYFHHEYTSQFGGGGNETVGFCDATFDVGPLSGLGCSTDCTVLPGYTCSGEPSVCVATCGDGTIAGTEICDDGNTTSGDGCDGNCRPTGCGSGIVTGAETCDDGNTMSGDGCDANCTPTACGNGETVPPELCDDGNTTSGEAATKTAGPRAAAAAS
jgi:cysteine-rich repeat protein